MSRVQGHFAVLLGKYDLRGCVEGCRVLFLGVLGVVKDVGHGLDQETLFLLAVQRCSSRIAAEFFYQLYSGRVLPDFTCGKAFPARILASELDLLRN